MDGDADITFSLSFSLINSFAFFLIFCINIRTAPHVPPSALTPCSSRSARPAHSFPDLCGLLSLEFMRAELAFVDSNKSTASGGSSHGLSWGSHIPPFQILLSHCFL